MFKVNSKDTRTQDTLNFQLPLRGLSNMRNLQFFTFEEDKVFSIGREGGDPSPLFKNLLMPSPPHTHTSISLPKTPQPSFYSPPPKVHPELNNNFQVITK